jgi:hypothetical protein
MPSTKASRALFGHVKGCCAIEYSPILEAAIRYDGLIAKVLKLGK